MSKEIWTSDQLNTLIEEINNGNKEAARQLISNYADDIHFQAALYNSDKEAVSACYQRACNAAIKGISALDSESPEKWLENIAAETAVSSAEFTLESAEADYDSSNEFADTNVSFPEDKADIRKGILHAMKGMTAAERAVFVLRFYEHMSNSETAQKLHLDTTQVEALLTNAKSVLNSKDISVPAVIAAMNKLNPVKKDEEPAVTPVIPAAVDTVSAPKKTPGPKALLLALAAVLILAGIFIFVSGRGKNPEKPNADVDNTINDQTTHEVIDSSENNSETSTDQEPSSNHDSSESVENSEGKNNDSSSGSGHGLTIENEIVDHIDTSGNNSSTSGNNNSGTSGNSGSQSGTASGSGDNNTNTSTPSGNDSTSPDNSDSDAPDQEIDLGGGDILGGF